MNRLFSTILLAILCAASLILFLYQSGNGKLAQIFGKPALEEGAPLLDFQRKEIHQIKIKEDNQTILYQKTDQQWQIISPDTPERADYRKLEKLLFLIESARVISPLTELPESESLQNITLKNRKGDVFHFSYLGAIPRYTDVKKLIPSFAIQLPDNRIYACTSSLDEELPQVQNEGLIDHRPFFFHPQMLSEITYQDQEQVISLKREAIDSPWEIITPLKLRTNRKAVEKLIHTLYILEADSVESTANAKENPRTLTIRAFNTLDTQTLSFSENSLGGTNQTAQSYTFKEDQLSNVIPDLDTLRSKQISAIEVKDIGSIILQSKSQPFPVTLKTMNMMNGSPRWMYQTSNRWLPACEISVTELITALTQDEVDGFSLETLPKGEESDKSVSIITKTGERLQFDLFIKDGNLLLQEQDGGESFILNLSHYNKIRTATTDWKVKSLWEFSPVSLRGLQRQILNQPVENYSYNFNLDEWKGQVGTKRIDGEVDLVTAAAFLEILEALTVIKWLSPSDTLLDSIPNSPDLRILILSEYFTQDGDSRGMLSSSLTTYRHSRLKGFSIAILEIDGQTPQYALLDETTVHALSQSLLYE